MMKTKLLYFFILFFSHYILVAQILPSQNIVCQNQTETYSSDILYDSYQWTVVGGTPTSSTSSTINVSWGAGNRGSIQLEGYIGAVSQGKITRKIYIDQKSAYVPTSNPTILQGLSTNIGLNFANKSLKLNGTTDYVGIANSNLINSGTTNYRTVMLWFKANNVTTRQVLYNEGGASNGFSMYIEGGKVYALGWEGNTAWTAPNANIVTGQWYHIAFVYDKDATDTYQFKGYLNGNSIGQFKNIVGAADGMNSHSGPVAIGSNSNIRFHDNSTSQNNYFNGKIDGFKLWNRALTATEIPFEKDHVLNTPVVDANLDVYINFDNSVLDIANTASAEDGAIYGNPTYDNDSPLLPTILWSPGGATTSSINVTPTTNTTYSYTLTEKLSNICSQTGSIDVYVTIPNDTDGDGVSNIFDLDSDNDGILNAVENNCLPVTGVDANWPMDNSTNDVSGTPKNAVNGSVSFSTDSKKGTHAASFNGSSNFLQYSNGVFLNQAITYFSYSLWIKPSSLTGIQTIFEEGGTTNGIAVRLNGNTLEAAVRESSAQLNTSTFTYPSDGLWHHIALTYNNGSVILYLDGVPSTTLATGFGELAAHSDVQNFGHSNGGAFGSSSGNYFGGLMDDILHFPSVLSPADINKIIAGCDTDNDGIPNHLDWDSDNDGCFDTNEAYGTLVDTNNDGTYGGITGSAQVDASGKVIAASYGTPATTSGGKNSYQEGVSVVVSTGANNQNICAGQTAVFSAIATATILPTIPATTASTNLTYQWQLSSNNGLSYTNISGQTATVTSGTLVSLTLTNVTAGMSGNRYRVKFTNEANNCGASATATLTVSEIPTITGFTNAASCGNGIVILNATASAGTINWYAAATGGAVLGTGTSFTTPVLSTTTTYWVDATNNGCITASRTAVIATISTGVVEIAASSGVVFGCYSSLKGAFDKINDGTHQGNITIKIRGNTTETATAALNNSGNVSGALYTSVLLYPTAPNLKIEGNLVGQLINLDGADNVTIDGRVSQLGGISLTLSNSNTGGSVVQFINDASTNNLKYTNIQGVTTAATSGLVVFGAGVLDGNDNNTIEYCDIRDGVTTPTNAVYSAGTAVGTDNGGNFILNNNIYNYYSATAASNGINIASNSSAWIISNNRFFQTSTRTTTIATLTHRAINISTASGVNYTISNNTIGFANASGTGTSIYTGQSTSFRAIEMNVGTASVSNVKGNVISNIDFSTTIGTATNAGIFSGISILGGNVNVGGPLTADGNVIGATTGNSSLKVTSTVSLGLINGIFNTSTGTVEIKNNKIGAISTGGSATIGYTFNGIYSAGVGGNFDIANNIVGSTTTANSISIGDGATTSPICTLRGIYNLASGTISITNNIVQNNTVYGTGLSVLNGIINGAGSGILNINANNVISCTNTGTGIFVGITNSATVNITNLNNNVLRSLSKLATTGTFTAISNSGAVLSAVNINDNKLGDATGGLIIYTAENTVALTGISNTGGTASCELSIQRNDIRGIAHTGAASSPHTYIINSATTLKQNISYNTFTNLNVNTIGAIVFIQNNVAMPINGVQNIDNNSIVGTFVRNSASSSGAITLFTSTTTTSNTNVTVTNNNNNFSNITISGAATISGWVNTDAGTVNVNKTIYNNKFENWTGGSGTITALNVNIVSETNKTYSNSIQNITNSGTLTAIATAAGSDKIYQNTINNLNSSGSIASTITGINITAGTTKNVYQNTISNLTGSSFTTGSVRGMLISGGTTVNVYENKIFGLSASANTTGTLSGIWVTGGSTVNIDRNKIYDISSSSAAVSSGLVYGIQVSGATASLVTNISNNLIGDLRVTAASGTDLIRGLGLISTGATSTSNVYYNTVYLNAAASSGTNSGSSGIYHTTSTTATTATLNLRNNIIINNSAVKGTGTAVAYRRSAGTAGTLSNYASTSKNNLFYAGTPSTTRLIYGDGTSIAQTFAQYKNGLFTAGTIAPRDQVSVSENLNFISTNGASDDFLKVNTTIATQIESGAVNITDYAVDYLGVIRQGNTGYIGTSTTGTDIGAYENEYVPTDQSPPSITYVPLTNNSCLSNKTISAIISDATGVNVTAGTRPRIYFKKSTNSNVLPTTNNNTTNGWKYIETTGTVSPFEFSIDYSLIFGGVATGDVMQYFITAQDIVNPTPYVGINTGVFAVAPTSVALTSTAFPIGGTINSFTILAGLSGTVTVGSGGNYPTLTEVGGLFEAINNNGLAGNLTANIIGDISATGAVSLNAISYGCAAFSTLTISPSGGVARTISGTVAGGALLNFNGADYVVIDGLNTGGNSLTILNSSTSSVAGTSTIRFINDATNNSVRNCTIEGAGTLVGSGTIFFSTGASSGNDDNTVDNNIIRAVGTNLQTNAIYSAGTSVLVDNSKITINNNTIQDYYNAALASNGILVASNSSAWTITGNKFFQTATRTATVGNGHRGINIITASGINYTVSNNIIGYSNASSTGTTVYDGAFSNRFNGIEMTVGISSESNVRGNKIAGINLSNTGTAITAAPGIFSGISILAGKVTIGGALPVDGNTIGETTGNASITISSSITGNYIAGIYGISTSLINIQNNKIGAISTGGGAGIGYTFHGINAAGGGQFSISDNIIGSTITANSIAIGTLGTTTSGICTLYGITNTSTGGITIGNNTIQNVSSYGTTAASVLTGIWNSGIAGTASITNNNIIATSNTGVGLLTGIFNSAAASNVFITTNIIRNITKSVATGGVTAISNTGGVLASLSIDGNQLGNIDGGLINYSVANSSALIGISNTGGSANCAVSIQNNDIRGISHSVLGSSAHTYIINSAATLSQNINGNTFTGLSVNTTGAIIFISNSVVMPVNGVQNVNSNSIVSSFTRVASSGALTLFTSTVSTSNNNVIVNNNNNNFSNITINGTATIAGWVNIDAGAGSVTKTISGNTFSNWNGGTGTGLITAMNVNISSANNATNSNIINTISSAGTIYGIVTGPGNDKIYSNTIHSLISTGATATIVNGIAITNGTVKNIYQNTIYNLQANTITTGSISGIAVNGGANNSIYRNKIYDILSSSAGITTGSVNGILISGTIADQITTIHNNRIGNIQASAANAANPVNGISITNTGLRSISNVYFNTVYLNATSSGTNFGSTGVFHTVSTTASTGSLNLRNNIIANLSTKNGTGQTVAFRQSSGTGNQLNNYNSLSNNNLFYAGAPSATNLIYSNGTSTAIDIAAYKAGTYTAGTIAPRDQLSISENPQFISIVGTSPDFLKLSNAEITFIESGAVNISGITTDFEGENRAGNTGYLPQVNGAGSAPDIGADEFDGKLPNVIVSGAHTLSNGAYAKVSDAFTAINASVQTGNSIVVTLIGSTSENTTATLNQGTWASLKLYPTKTGVSIAGTIVGAPIIDLNGADNVTIDGRVNQTGSTKSLSIINSSTSTSVGTSTISLRNSAESNILKYLNINGSSSSAVNGVVEFATSTAGNGNDTNIIEYNSISNANGNRPVNAVYVVGSAGSDNSSNIIRNNNIFDFINSSTSSNGIYLGAFTTACNISNNNFYETLDFAPAVATNIYSAISIDNAIGTNFVVSNNYIGGKTIASGGGAWTVNANTNHSFRAIYLNVGTTTASSVQGNIIKNFSYTSSSTSPWRAIEVNAGAVNIGAITGNTIGAVTGTASITVTSTINAQSYGMYIGSAGTITISKNNIGSISIFGNSTNASHSFAGIYKKSGIAGIATISNNIIGSTTTTNSIAIGSTASASTIGQNLWGIFIESTGTHTISNNSIVNFNNAYTGIQESRTVGIYGTAGASTLTKNTIYNLSSAALGTTVNAVSGIEMRGTDNTNVVTESVVYNLSSTNTSFAGSVSGIYFSGDSGSNLVNRNFIKSITVNGSAVNASIYGIYIASGNSTFSNNIITLGGNTNTLIYGIYDSGTGPLSNQSKLYFNTVYIGGDLTSGSTKSYAVFSANNNNTRDYRNNIFANYRSTVGGSNLHYGAYLNYTTATNLTIDSNNYYTAGVGGVIGYYNGANRTALPIVTAQDGNSTVEETKFINRGGNAAADYKLTVSANGVYGTGISLDYGLTARGNPPNIGAWEFNANLWMGTVNTDFANPANWSAGAVPLDEAPVVFASDPSNSCYLDSNRTLSNIINAQSTDTFVLNGYQLTLKGGLYFSNGAKLDATNSSSKLVFDGDEIQLIPNGAFVGNTVPFITVNNDFGVVTSGNFTITNTLSLQSANASATKGTLDTETNVITMGADAVTIGDGDVTGIVKRTSFVYQKTYTFGNRLASVYFESTGTLPTEISVRMTLGVAPTWNATGVKRIFEFIQTGANPLVPTAATITANYLDSELEGNSEDFLVFQSYRNPPGTFFEHGRASNNTSDNWVKLTNINMAFFPATFGTLQLGMGNYEVETLTWNGSASTSWTTVNNWTSPNGKFAAPSDFVNIIIPNAGTTPNDPILPPQTTIKSLKLESGSILNAVSNTLFTLESGSNVWVNEGGTFNPNTSTIVFTNKDADISGATSFHNVTIQENATLVMKDGSTMRIAGVMNNIGVWATAKDGNRTTVDYNGAAQNVVIANAATNRYSTLILSGSGFKTLPSQILSILGDLTLTGTASTTTPSNTVIAGNLSIGVNNTFDAAAKTHTVGGDLVHNGTFNTAGSTFVMNGLTAAQSITGTATTTDFDNLVLLNTYGVTSAKNLTVNGVLDMQSENPSASAGSFDMISNAVLSLNENAVVTGIGDVTGIVKRAHTFVTNKPYVFGNKNTVITFGSSGTKPTQVSVKTTIGNAPSWKSTAIKRVYDLAQTGGNNNYVTVQLNYLDSELNGADESELVFFGAIGLPTPSIVEWGYNTKDESNNIIDLKNVNIGLRPSAFGQTEIALSESENPNLTWTGSQSTDWNNPFNWSPASYPNKFTRMTIPNATSTPFDPILPVLAEGHQLIIQNGGILNANAGSEYYLRNKDGEIAWQNNGGVFNANTSSVTFSDPNLKISGTTNFYNIIIDSGASLTPQLNNSIGIAGSITNNGILDATTFANTIEYNGINQTVIIPDGGRGGYHNLIFSNDGIKTMLPTAGGIPLLIAGTFTVTATANSTAVNPLHIEGNVFVGANASFTSGAFLHNIGGDLISNGSFTASDASTIEMNGVGNQSIGGAVTPLLLENLTVSNVGGTVSTTRDLTCNGNFTNSGILDMKNYILSVNSTISNTGTLMTAVPASQSLIPIPPGADWGGTVVFNGGAAQNAVPGNYTNMTIDNGIGVTVTNAAQVAISGNLLINNGKKLNIEGNNLLTVTGSITNNAGTSGFVLKSNASGTASLIHNTNNVPATVQRYISGSAEAWHFLSTPVSNQVIAGSPWVPSGTYGNGTGYDLYLWDEPTPCWTYQLNTTVAPTWPSKHSSPNFIPGRGYLYATQALNPTKEFIGSLNNGDVSYPLTNSSPDLTVKGFNLVGNPYPSSIDWKALSGWTRSNLVNSGGGYDMWIWNPTANNYGVYNSLGTIGTNSVTQYIPPTQGFFVRASTVTSIAMTNAIRVNNGASNWMKIKNKKENRLKVKIESKDGNGYDEVLLQFGYPTNEPGALKLFSRNESAPSAYLNDLKNDLSVRYLTDTDENLKVPLNFKAGKDGNYSLSISSESTNFDVLLLEDKKTKTVSDLNINPNYEFKGSVKDAVDRFVLHFATIEKEVKTLPASIYYDGNEINVDLTLVEEQTTIKVYDMLGKLLVDKKVEGKMIHRFIINPKNEVYIVLVNSKGKSVTRKVLVY